MMQRKLISITLGAMLFTGTTTVPAQAPEKGFYFGPSVGYYHFDDDGKDNAENGPLYGLGIGYQFNRNFAFDASYFRLDSEVADENIADVKGDFYHSHIDLKFDMFRLDGLFSLDFSSPWSPYLAVGYTNIESYSQHYGDDNDMLDVGFGLKGLITPEISLRSDVRANFDDGKTDYSFNVGLYYQFGAPHGHPCERLDDDSDEINNCDDVCPGTVVGARVAMEGQNKGCSCERLDDDRDGFNNCVDVCPGTEFGARVANTGENKGCSCKRLDDDGDGINNCDDVCPGTESGARVVDTGECKGCRIFEKPVEFTLKVQFDTNKAVVKREYFQEIQKVADFMDKHPTTSTEIQGHGDSRSTKYEGGNQKLSEDRAVAVRDVLLDEDKMEVDIASSRLEAVGYGVKYPILDKTGKEDWEKSRRVVAEIKTVVDVPEPACYHKDKD